MADISMEIKNFREAVYGEEVRGSMVSLAEKVNTESANAAESAKQSAKDANTAVNMANTAKEQCDTAATNANAKAALADSKATLANNAAAEANNKATAANTAATNANTKATLADNAATAANTAATNANAKAALADSKATLANNAAAEANNKATAANTAADKADDAAELANTKAALANDKATLANAAATNANAKAALADGKATLANNAATAAMTAKDAANTAADKADDASELADTKAALADGKATAADKAAKNADSKATLANSAATAANTAADRANAAAELAEDVVEGTGLIPTVQKGAANGVATLDANVRVPAAQLGNVTKTLVGLGNVPNVATNDLTPTYTQAASRENLSSGEKLSKALGKIKKYFADLKAVAFSGSYKDLSNTPTLGTAAGCNVVNDFTTTAANTVMDGRAGKTLGDRVDELNRNLEPHIVTAWIDNAFTYTGSSTGLGAIFPCSASARKLYSNFYQIDVKISAEVNVTPDNYFGYGISSHTICQALFNTAPKSTFGGFCSIYNADGTMDMRLAGYGALFSTPAPNMLQVSRYYTSTGSIGVWTLNGLKGRFIYGSFYVYI